MAYYLAVERNVDSYEAIGIKNTRKGRVILSQTNNNNYECTLEEIDKYTTQYDSLQALKYALYSENKISWPNCPLAIVYSDKKELRITKGILLSSSKEYLEKPSKIYEYLINKFCNQDITFANELLKTISKSSPRYYKIEELIESMEKSIEHNIPEEVKHSLQVVEMILHNIDQNGTVIKPKMIDYQQLHNLALIITNYENKLKLDKQSYTRTKTKNT